MPMQSVRLVQTDSKVSPAGSPRKNLLAAEVIGWPAVVAACWQSAVAPDAVGITP